MKMHNFVTISFPQPIDEITSIDNVVVSNDGEICSCYESWFGNYPDEELEKLTESERFLTLNQRYRDELESGFIFSNEWEAKSFVCAMRYAVDR